MNSDEAPANPQQLESPVEDAVIKTVLHVLLMMLAYGLVGIVLLVFPVAMNIPGIVAAEGSVLRGILSLGEHAVLVFGMSILAGFWQVAFIPGLVWIVLRQNFGPGLALLGTVVAGLYWAEILAGQSGFNVMPGYFGRAIDGGMPTIHYYIDKLINLGLTILTYELLVFWIGRRRRG